MTCIGPTLTASEERRVGRQFAAAERFLSTEVASTPRALRPGYSVTKWLALSPAARATYVRAVLEVQLVRGRLSQAPPV